MKFKQIKDPALQYEYSEAGLLWKDCEPFDVYWKAPYWRKTERSIETGSSFPKLCLAGDYLPGHRGYMWFLLVED